MVDVHYYIAVNEEEMVLNTLDRCMAVYRTFGWPPMGFPSASVGWTAKRLLRAGHKALHFYILFIPIPSFFSEPLCEVSSIPS